MSGKCSLREQGFTFVCVGWKEGWRRVFLPVPSSSPRKKKDLPLFHSHGSSYGRLHLRDICSAINNRARLRVPPAIDPVSRCVVAPGPALYPPKLCTLCYLRSLWGATVHVPSTFSGGFSPHQTAPTLPEPLSGETRVATERVGGAAGGPEPHICFCSCAPQAAGCVASHPRMIETSIDIFNEWTKLSLGIPGLFLVSSRAFFLFVLDTMESVEKECGALGGLFQAIVNDMKVTRRYSASLGFWSDLCGCTVAKQTHLFFYCLCLFHRVLPHIPHGTPLQDRPRDEACFSLCYLHNVQQVRQESGCHNSQAGVPTCLPNTNCSDESIILSYVKEMPNGVAPVVLTQIQRVLIFFWII